MTNLDSILKSRGIALPTKTPIVKAKVFPVVTYRCLCWSIKTVHHRRIVALKSWGWRRLLRIPWNARRSNQSLPKEINPKYSLEGPMLLLTLLRSLLQVWVLGLILPQAH